jgi:hypothetical protein
MTEIWRTSFGSSLIEVIKESCDASQEAKVMSIEAISAGTLLLILLPFRASSSD